MKPCVSELFIKAQFKHRLEGSHYWMFGLKGDK